jgi:hypothetical protein
MHEWRLALCRAIMLTQVAQDLTGPGTRTGLHSLPFRSLTGLIAAVQLTNGPYGSTFENNALVKDVGCRLLHRDIPN